ncbi:MAG: hypothetical protein HZB26_19705 [Candidatus Hydrogenedentes bacterium]|nr:hypothetical protein [Candidatus Hydrogenedentota bacterium]
MLTGRAKGGKARAEILTPERRKEIASNASLARWAKAKTKQDAVEAVEEREDRVPIAKWRGFLALEGFGEVPCYVLETGERVIGRTSATEMLTGIKGGGDLEKYLGVKAFKPFIDIDLILEKMMPFRLPEVEGLERSVKGLRSDVLIDICRGFVAAREAADKDERMNLTPRQREMAGKAALFLSAIAKTGLDALIDEVTGYQYERPDDALQLRLRAYLSEEMREWEKTFPDQLWSELGRLTNWKGAISKRPKYWGRLVNELVYDYLDPDVAKWLRENAPRPKHGQNYHQWLSGQFGLQRLLEVIWKFIGVSGTCKTLAECRQKWAEINGKQVVQMYFAYPQDTQ